MRAFLLAALLPISLFAETPLEETYHFVVEQLPEYPAKEVSVIPHPAGATNDNYIVSLDGRRYFLRQGSLEAQEMGANLEQEYLCTKFAAAQGFAPDVVLFFSKEKVLVSDFVENATLMDPNDPAQVHELMTNVRQLHEFPIVFDRTFCPFEKIRYFLALAEERGVVFPDFVTESLLPAAFKIEQVFGEVEKKPCHMDLHRKNILFQNGRLWMVDWEFSAMADPYFDLSTFAAISLYGDREMRYLLNSYQGGSVSEKEFARFDLMRIVCDVHWTLWNLIQAQTSTHDAPYEIFAAEFYDDALIRIHRPDFERHLSQIQKVE